MPPDAALVQAIMEAFVERTVPQDTPLDRTEGGYYRSASADQLPPMLKLHFTCHGCRQGGKNGCR